MKVLPLLPKQELILLPNIEPRRGLVSAKIKSSNIGITECLGLALITSLKLIYHLKESIVYPDSKVQNQPNLGMQKEWELLVEGLKVMIFL